MCEILQHTADVRLRARDASVEELFRDSLAEALSRAHIERVAFHDVSFERLTGTEADAVLAGAPAQFTQDIKAVTYHEADVRQMNGARARRASRRRSRASCPSV